MVVDNQDKFGISNSLSKVNDDIENLSVDVTCHEDAESEEYISDDEDLC